MPLLIRPRLSKEAGRQAEADVGRGRMMERNASYRVLIHLKEAERTEQDVYRSRSQLCLKHNKHLPGTYRFKKDNSWTIFRTCGKCGEEAVGRVGTDNVCEAQTVVFPGGCQK